MGMTLTDEKIGALSSGIFDTVHHLIAFCSDPEGNQMPSGLGQSCMESVETAEPHE